MAYVFNMNRKTVRKTIYNPPQDPKEPGRHHKLNDEFENQIIQEIQSAYNSGKSITQKQIINYVLENFKISVTNGWVNSFICRHQNDIQKCKSYPQEDLRMTVPREYLDTHILNLKEYIQGMCSELLFNLDEVGTSEWEERKILKVVVPKSADKNGVQHHVPRNTTHMTLLVCVSSAGDALTPMLITKCAIPQDFEKTGVRLGEDIIIKQKNTPYMDDALFTEYITTVLIPYISNLRQNNMYINEKAVILMDNARCHCSESVLKILGENNIYALTYPSHTSHIFQALDLSFFGVFKKNKSIENQNLAASKQINAILNVIQSYEKTATSMNIRSSFRESGISINYGKLPRRIDINEDNIRQNKEFKELWNLNVPIEALSKRRQNSQFGLINKEFIINN